MVDHLGPLTKQSGGALRGFGWEQWEQWAAMTDSITGEQRAASL